MKKVELQAKSRIKARIIVAIFAHPDDEAFGPSGTLAKFAKDGHDVYLLCATRGEGGENHLPEKSEKNLNEIREEELRCSAKKLGIKKVFFLGFIDGTLSNNLYHQVADKITEIITPLKPEIIITEEYRGVSGHLDHIAISMISSYVFQKLNFVKKIMYHYVTKQYRLLMPSDYFIFIPPGYDESEADEIIDTTDVWETKISAIQCHQSQLKDVNRTLNRLKQVPKKDYFFVTTK
jgi:N-acetylglucosamine malate deacetylase 2